MRNANGSGHEQRRQTDGPGKDEVDTRFGGGFSSVFIGFGVYGVTLEISKFPAVKRDLALLLDKNVQFAEIEKIAYDTEKKLLKEVELFDVYEGKNLEPGKKSYAVSFLLQDESQTLNDKMIDKIMSKLVKNLEDKLGAKLR